MSSILSSQSHPRDTRLSGWYHCLPEVEPLPCLEREITADVVIIGAGFAGLSAAKRLHDNDPMLEVVVLDAQGLAWSASGRNSGFMIDLPHELNSEDYASEQQHDLGQISENRAAISFAEQAAEEYRMSSHFVRAGKYHGATNGAGIKALNNFAKHLDRLGERYTQLTASDLKNVTGSDYYDGGIFTPGAALIQPAGYIRGLGYGLNALDNVSIYEHSPVTSIESLPSGVTVSTHKGRINAKHAILANNGHIESFGIAKGQLLHLFSYASLTEKLSSELLAQLGEQNSWGLIPASPMGTTLRKLDNGRLLVRNQWTYNPDIESTDTELERYGRQHDRCFARRYPKLAGIPMEYRWSGAIAMTLNSAPVFGELQGNVYAAAVCQGLGTTKSTLYGMLIADKICARKNSMLEALEQAPEPSWMPPRLLNNIGVPAYLKWVHWRAGSDL